MGSRRWIFWVVSLEPFFQASLCSTKYITGERRSENYDPVVMERFSDPSSVTVSGSNSLIIFILRAAVWFGGLYLVFSELGIELAWSTGFFSWVFSPIIGLAMQQTSET